MTEKTKDIQSDDQAQLPELQTEIVKIRRTSVVLKGGRAFSFSAMVVVGNGQGSVGVGVGSGLEVSIAIQKATKQAKQDLSPIVLNGQTILHSTISRFGATKVVMRPGSPGSGIIAGGAMRLVFKVAGIKDVLAKILGSANAYNVCYATVRGLREMHSPQSVIAKTGVSKEDLALCYQSAEEVDHG